MLVNSCGQRGIKKEISFRDRFVSISQSVSFSLLLYPSLLSSDRGETREIKDGQNRTHKVTKASYRSGMKFKTSAIKHGRSGVSSDLQ